jgi:adenosylhomocysteine nucleosidase
MSGEDAGTSARTTAHPTPAPAPADIGIVAALPIEVGPLIKRLERVRKYAGPRHKVIEGECSGKLIALILTGPGRKASRRGGQVLIEGHRPRWIISAGFGGGLDPSLMRNDVVFATEVIDEDDGRWSIDVTVPEGSQSPRIVAGRLLTVDRIVMTADEKAELRSRHQADVVDMETSAVAALCSERASKFLAIRVVSDAAGADLPPEILSILGRSGGYRVGAAVGAIWRRPSSLKDLWALREHAMAAAERLAEIVAGVLVRLP